MSTIRISKFLSLVLRHRPEAVGISLDDEGWADVGTLLEGMARRGSHINFKQLVDMVEANDKKRFAFDRTQKKIRAVQGHSLKVQLGLIPVAPPSELFHGTTGKFLPSIRNDGLIRGLRQYVHLSSDRETATKSGARRGEPVVLIVESATMHAQGHVFYQADNGVWLTEHVPPRYISGLKG